MNNNETTHPHKHTQTKKKQKQEQHPIYPMCKNCPNKCLDVLIEPLGVPIALNRSLPLTKTSLLYDYYTTGIDIFPPFSQPSHAWSSVTAPLASSWSRCWIPGNPEAEKRTGSNGVFTHPVLKRCGSGWWMLGCFRPPRGCCGKWWIPHLVAFIYLGDSPPFPLPKKGEGDMDPGGNLINLSPFKKLQKKYISKVAEEKWAKSSWGGFHRSSWLFYMSGE